MQTSEGRYEYSKGVLKRDGLVVGEGLRAVLMEKGFWAMEKGRVLYFVSEKGLRRLELWDGLRVERVLRVEMSVYVEGRERFLYDLVGGKIMAVERVQKGEGRWLVFEDKALEVRTSRLELLRRLEFPFLVVSAWDGGVYLVVELRLSSLEHKLVVLKNFLPVGEMKAFPYHGQERFLRMGRLLVLERLPRLYLFHSTYGAKSFSGVEKVFIRGSYLAVLRRGGELMLIHTEKFSLLGWEKVRGFEKKNGYVSFGLEDGKTLLLWREGFLKVRAHFKDHQAIGRILSAPNNVVKEALN